MIGKKTILAAAAALLFTLTASPTMAADAQPTARQMDLSKRLFADMQMDRMMRAMMTQMGPAMMTQMRKSNPNITDEQAKAIADSIGEVMGDVGQKMMDRMIPLYAVTFSEKELEDTVAFYEGPSGKAMLAKMPALTARMMPMMTDMMPEITAQLQQRVCAKIDCTKATSSPKT